MELAAGQGWMAAGMVGSGASWETCMRAQTCSEPCYEVAELSCDTAQGMQSVLNHCHALLLQGRTAYITFCITNLLLQVQGREHGVLAGNQEQLLHRRLDRQRAAPDARRVRRQLAPAQDGVAQLRRGGGDDVLRPVLLLRLLRKEHLGQATQDVCVDGSSAEVQMGQ